MTLTDLAAYTPKTRTPLCGEYRGYRLCGMPPPNSGAIAVLQTLGILQQFDVAGLAPNSADAVHVISEAYRLAFADRANYVGDPDFVQVPVMGLLDTAYLKSRASLISRDKSLGVAPAGTPQAAQTRGLDQSLSLPSTSHMAIVDGDGRMVNMTTTIENGFGSLQMVKGFLLNNQLTDFSLAPTDAEGSPSPTVSSPANARAARWRRPWSSIATVRSRRSWVRRGAATSSSTSPRPWSA